MTDSVLPVMTALFGCPAAGQPAQYLFERAFTAAGLDWRFLTCEVSTEALEHAVRGGVAMGFRGCLLAGPLQQQAATLVDETTPAASFASAVSRIDFRDGRLCGDMTEGRGTVEAIRLHGEPTEQGVLVLGTDAAARAVGLELALARTKLVILAGHEREALSHATEAIAGLDAAPVAAYHWTDRLTIPEEVKIVVATEPIDAAHASGIQGLRPDLIVVDLQVASQTSPLIAVARQHGCCTVDGHDVRCEQAAIDFQAWTGLEADAEVLRDALDEFFSA
ncbi:MAG: shikimate dehydrogenase family protein [Pirellulales bacterium]|jgi:shikimate dehydrogenase